VYGGVPPDALALKETDCPTAGTGGVKVKSAMSAPPIEIGLTTVAVWLAESWTVRVTE
jgi:hypothetical protein